MYGGGVLDSPFPSNSPPGCGDLAGIAGGGARGLALPPAVSDQPDGLGGGPSGLNCGEGAGGAVNAWGGMMVWRLAE